MKNGIKKTLSIVLCGALLTGGVEATVYAMNTEKPEEETKEFLSVPAAEEKTGIGKDETVYVFTGADGSVEKIIVSDWIKNAIGSKSVSDQSELTGVENIKGEETCTVSGENLRVWDAQGNDIYYRGNIEKELPVEMSISYHLDGKSISPEELAGKSGRVTIRFDYQNHQYKTVEIDGKQEKIYVPFVMLTGILFENDVVTNVEVVNGKLMNDGNRTAVIGIAFPGLQESLDIAAEKFEIPDYVEISADVTNFEMSNTITVAVNGIFSRFALEETGTAEETADSLKLLADAMTQLTDGSSQLYGGLCTLLEKSGELVNGVNQLSGGAEALKNGAGELSSGSAELADGVKALAGALGELSAGNDTLNAGAKQVFDSLLETADAQLAAAGINVPELTVENYADTLNAVIASLTPAPAEQAGAAAVLLALKEQLDRYNAFYTGLCRYTAGVDSAKAGAEALGAGAGGLEAGAAKLYTSMEELYAGLGTLKDGMPALTGGITELRDGAKELSDGLKEFDENGIRKLTDAVDGNLKGLFVRIRAVTDAAKEYTSFSGISEDMDGQVKFIYRTDAIYSRP